MKLIKDLPAEGYFTITEDDKIKFDTIQSTLVQNGYLLLSISDIPLRHDNQDRIIISWYIENEKKYFKISTNPFLISMLELDSTLYVSDDEILEPVTFSSHYRNFWLINNVQYYYGREYEFAIKDTDVWVKRTLLGVSIDCKKLIVSNSDFATIMTYDQIREPNIEAKKDVAKLIEKYDIDTIVSIVNNLQNK